MKMETRGDGFQEWMGYDARFFDSMRLEIEANGITRDVTLEQVQHHQGRFRISWDGITRTVDARVVGRELDDLLLSLVFLEGCAASRQVRCSEKAPKSGELTIHSNGASQHATVNGRRRGAEDGRGAKSSGGEERIVAPMPGKLVRVLVSLGDCVDVRQPLIVVEAMKMENEIVSSKKGIVKELPVREGTPVVAGRLLAVVE